MKRLTIVLLCVALAFSLVACGGNKEPVTDPGTSEQETTTSTEAVKPTESTDATDSTTSTEAVSTTGKTEASKTEASKTESTATTTTTKKPTSAGSTTKPSDNYVNWEDAFGADTTAPSGSNSTTTTTTTTTTKATTTTTVPPTKVEEVLLPAVGTDVDVVKQKGRIRISEVKLDKNVLTITIKNESESWINQETDWVKYTCYDKDGKELIGEGDEFGRVYLGCLECGDSTTDSITLPAGTAKVEITDCEIVYWTPWK